jgi:hypothetical protein
MNIHCVWNKEGACLEVWAGRVQIGYVQDGDDIGSEPVLTLTNGDNPSLTFSEIEHIMDCWHNMPRE